jgi:hypothetical protein
MEKQVQYFGRTNTGIFCQALFGSSGSFEKVAGAPPFADWATGDELRRFIERGITRSDRRDNVYVLVNALGAGEFFGSNINADFFRWEVLAHRGMDYGHQTFLNAHAYQHHVNKDHTRAFGQPVLSLLNDPMRRVELIVRLNREKAKFEGALGVIERIDRGEFPDVSMGCFLAGTLVSMADGTRKPIEQIQVGDYVLTHLGRARRVTEVHRRQYKGQLHTIKAECHRPIRTTRQHPFWSVPESQVKQPDDHANLRWLDGVTLNPDWTCAEHLRDEYLLAPVLQPSARHYGSYHLELTRAEARLLGYYLAEGHLLRNREGEYVGIELTTHVDDPIHGEIDDLCREFGTVNPPSTHGRENSEKSVGIYIHDKRLARLCINHAGCYSKKKRLSKEVLSAPTSYLLDLFGAYANGDGHGPEDGSLKFSTASEDLSWQLVTVLPRLGVIPSRSVLTHRPNELVRIQTLEYVVHVGKQQAKVFAETCSKLKLAEVLKTKNSRRILDGYVVTPIREHSSMYVETEVFNFEVEEDNSYLVEGLAVHNCKVPYDVCMVCGNRSKNEEDYCVHMRPPQELLHLYGPNKILADGSKCCVDNPFARFFDISFVFIGADKTAKVMAKLASKGAQLCIGNVCAIPRLSSEVASLTAPSRTEEPMVQKTASAPASSCDCACEGACGGDKLVEVFGQTKTARAKLGEFIKSVPAGPFAVRKLPLLEKGEPDMQAEQLDALSSKMPLGDTLAGLTGLGIVAKPHEFQRLVLTRMGRGELADELHEDRKVFRPVSDFHEKGGIGEIREDSLLQVLSVLKGLVSRRTALGIPFQMRVAFTVGSKEPLPCYSPVEDPLLDKISAAYNGYRRSILTKISQATSLVYGVPSLRSILLGNPLLDSFAKTASPQILTLDSLQYMMGAHLQDRGLLCTSAVGDLMAVQNGWSLFEDHLPA